MKTSKNTDSAAREYFVLGRASPASPTGKFFVAKSTIWLKFSWAAQWQTAIKFRTVKGAQRMQRRLDRAGDVYHIYSTRELGGEK